MVVKSGPVDAGQLLGEEPERCEMDKKLQLEARLKFDIKNKVGVYSQLSKYPHEGGKSEMVDSVYGPMALLVDCDADIKHVAIMEGETHTVRDDLLKKARDESENNYQIMLCLGVTPSLHSD